MYILNYEIIEKIAELGNDEQLKRLDVWLMQWFNSSDGLKIMLLQSLAEIYTGVVK